MTGMLGGRAAVVGLALACAVGAGRCEPSAEPEGTDELRWTAQVREDILEVFLDREGALCQHAALHLKSGYLRLVPDANSGWGTSIIVVPAFWEGGTYHQGAPVTAEVRTDGEDLVIALDSTISGLAVAGTVRLQPPADGAIRARVSVCASGAVDLDERPGEAFKPVMLSSMRISEDEWDAELAFVDDTDFGIPESGWIIYPPVTGTSFGLRGGTSSWKANAPTVTVKLEEPLSVTGWVTRSEDHNDDNVGLWASADAVLYAWEYEIVATSE